MKLGIFAKTFEGKDAETVLSAARSAGYQAVQYNMACSGLGSLPAAISEADAATVRAASEAAGISIAAVSATYNMIHPNPQEREIGRRSFHAIAAAAGQMGTRLLTLCTGSLDPYDQWKFHPGNAGSAAWTELCKEFDLLLSIAARYDLVLGVEPEPANVISSAERARKLLDTFRSERVQIVFDPANLFEEVSHKQGRRLVEHAIDLLGDSIALVHAKDRREDGQVVAVGDGALDHHHYLALLWRSGFKGAVITHGLTAEEAPRVAKFLQGQLAALEKNA